MKLIWAAGLVVCLAPLQAQDEKDHPPNMKTINASMKMLKASLETKNVAEAAEAAKKVEAAFSETRKYWAARQTKDALDWSDSAITGARLAQAGVSDGHWEKVSEGVSKMGGTCKSCHDVHRERLPDGTYKIKN
ncbi:MAG: hypothetical protein IT161_08095 [Bryobacterales bacterium]|nr:hypothetical protein [Bryobacterales bacterium]